MPPRAKRPHAFLTALLLAAWCPAGDARATDPRAADGGLNDLVIYLGGDHPRGLPEVEFRRIAGELDRLGIAIPPAVHVHRYYYNGNKQYQGPFVVGGPTVVVARHPGTNAQLYMEVQLPSGYPEIAYDDDSITYIYTDRRVELKFLHGLGHGSGDAFAVSYLPGRGLARRLHEAGRVRAEAREEAREADSLRRSLREARANAHDTMRGLSATTGAVVGRVTRTFGQVLSAAPGVRYLQSRGREEVTRVEEDRFRTAVERIRTEEIEYEPTVR